MTVEKAGLKGWWGGLWEKENDTELIGRSSTRFSFVILSQTLCGSNLQGEGKRSGDSEGYTETAYRKRMS